MSETGEDALTFLAALGMLVLVGSAVAARRVPMGQAAKMAIAWVAIFGVIFVGFSLRDDFKALGKRVFSQESAVVAAGGEARIRKNSDGHFYVDARINGQEVELLVDSGATVTTLSSDTAERLGLERTGLAPVIVETANGTARAWRSRAERLQVTGLVREDFPLHIAEARSGADLLGMNFLETLSAWRVEGEWLILTP